MAAGLLESAPGPLVVVCTHGDDIDDFIADLSLFSRTPAERFPAWESVPASSWSTTKSTASGCGCSSSSTTTPPRLIVHQHSSLLQPVPRRETLRGRPGG